MVVLDCDNFLGKRISSKDAAESQDDVEVPNKRMKPLFQPMQDNVNEIESAASKWFAEGTAIEVEFESEWWEANILEVQGDLVFVHYVGGLDDEDEWIEKNSGRIRIPVEFEYDGDWWDAFIVRQNNEQILVQLECGTEEDTEWVDSNSDRIRHRQDLSIKKVSQKQSKPKQPSIRSREPKTRVASTSKRVKRGKVNSRKGSKTSSRSKQSVDMDNSSEEEEKMVDIDSLDRDGQDQCKYNIDKILGMEMKKQLSENNEEIEVTFFLVKWREKSYLHTSWVTENDILAEGGKVRLNNFMSKWFDSIQFEVEDRDGNYFDPAFTEVERIVASRIVQIDSGEEALEYFCKWRNLPYSECTWEWKESIIESIGSVVAEEKIAQHNKFSKPPPRDKRKREKRPPVERICREDEIKEYISECQFKDQNVLREYQKEGVNWLIFNWYQRRGSILADEMGLGKTVQAVGFLEWLFQCRNRTGPFLVVAPLSTIPHWLREFEAWTNLNAIVFHGNQDSREILINHEFYYYDEKGKRINDCYKFNVLITTWEIVMKEDERGNKANLADMPWDCVIVDEAHRLKNKDSKTFTTLKSFKTIPPCTNPESEAHCILMTGTPLQNNTEELWCLLNFLAPKQFDDVDAFLNKFGVVETANQIMQLRKELRPYMLRRHKEDVERSIPPKEEIIVEVEMSQLQRTTYKSILERNFEWLKRGAAGVQVPALRNVEMELRKCCNHPYLVDGVEEQVRSRSTASDPMHELIRHSGKMVLLDKMLPKLRAEKHKALIFSQFIRVLDMLEDYMRAKSFPFERIDGRIRGNARQSAIDRYNELGEHRFVFLICTKAGGIGINLTTADTVIIFDSDWNPQNDLQAQARCHRIGQTREVKIYRFITAKTYERRMFEKASQKQGLERAVISGKQIAGVKRTSKEEKKELERLLRHGAYALFNQDAEQESNRFNEEDIESILSSRITKVIDKQERGCNTFSTASFVPKAAEEADLDYNDPDFWDKLMPEAEKKLTEGDKSWA